MKHPESQMLVIFGASGDLTKRKLIPAIYELFIREMLPDNFCILGCARTSYSDEEYRIMQKEFMMSLPKTKYKSEAKVDEFISKIFYISVNYSSDEDYKFLGLRIRGIQNELQIEDNIIYYLATPPSMYSVIPESLSKSGLNIACGNGWRKLIVEKPFGTDQQSAKSLNKILLKIFKEEEIYRIDHYLGKETVQNILVLRFANGIFEPLWNRNYVDYVEISASETLGVENRGKYYEGAGALKDMVQNHLIQLMGFAAMESPASFDPETIRDEVAKVLRSLRPFTTKEQMKDVIRGQYVASEIKGEKILGYREENNVAKDSKTETYVALKFFIDNWRWSGVPFFIYSGKRMAEKRSEIVVHFKSTPHTLFKGQCSGASCNKLTLRIQPDESISMRFGLKMPGAGFEVKQVSMDFKYSSLLGTEENKDSNNLPDAYERLIMDAMHGDSTLYTRSDALEASWKFVDSIIKQWNENPDLEIQAYPAGTNGPMQRCSILNENEGCEFYIHEQKL